ncbi:uncharacterized protein LOC107271719 [Cephus cinctus]|uniref:Uncharacterized protein LOC107271719 n=1 Tax=Cephus cinctus TaxID=211228 RepID=A0AAJ7C725_CEPCN|nr:uncharacterized protein LOC107271719 [Cephus cinctus]
MNRLKSFSYLSVRAYGVKKRHRLNPGVHTRLSAITQSDEQEQLEFLEDPENLDDLETDFMQVNKSHKEHERELKRNKERLKLNITARKYINEKQPSFLTTGEKQQIRILHEQDPVEWTPEKLSDSFPALPETIKKVLRAKWYPKTPEKVLEYDKNVADNWSKYKDGLLMLDSRLETHLSRFKDRKILMTNREEIATHLVAPSPNIPKPKSTLFSNIIKNYLDAHSVENNKKVAVIENQAETKRHRNENDNAINNSVDNESSLSNSEEHNVITLDDYRVEETITRVKHKQKHKKNEFMTVDNYLKQEVDEMTNVSSPIEVTILQAHRNNLEQSNLMESMNKCNVMETQERGKPNENAVTKEPIENDVISKSVMNNDSANLNNVVETMETHVKEWISKVEEEEEIPGYINIPKKKFKEGMIYRVKDCYYDDDGEFLYRVPGLEN